MKLAYFYIPNGTSTLTYNSEIILDNFTINECYFNKLKPVDSSCKFNIPFNNDIATALKTHGDEDIKVIVRDDVQTYFTGYLNKNFSFTKTTRNQPISIEIVSPSTLLDVELGTDTKKENQTLYQLLDYLLLQIGFISESKTIQSYSTCDYTLSKLNEKIDFALFEDTDNVKDLITDLCFECGCVFNFNAVGDFKLYPLFNDIGDITQVFDLSNMKEQLNIQKREPECDNVCGKWKEKKYYTNALIFSDTQNATDTNKCEITIAAGDYLFGEQTNYCEYDNENGSVLWADSATLTVEGITSSLITKENLGTRYSVSYQNNTSSEQKITRFDIYGNAWIETEGENLSKASTGENTKEFTFKYINSKTKANELVANILAYYQYSDFTGTIKSFSDYAIGSFVTITASGIGTINARIIQKKKEPNKSIEYKVEAVTEYTKQTVDTKKYRVSAKNGTVIDLISLQAAKVSKLFNTTQITLYRESASVLSSDDLPTSILTYNFETLSPSWNSYDAGYPTKSNGWSWVYPEDATATVYVTTGTAQSQANTATIQPSAWASPIPSGRDGTNGMNAYTLTLYTRTNDMPSFLPNTLTYNFKTGAIYGTRNGWQSSIPAVDDDGNPCWEIHATALSETDTDTIESSEWSTPVQITSDGITRAEVKEIVQEEMSDVIETPNIYGDFNATNVLVTSKGITPRQQEFEITIHVVQSNEELDFTFLTDSFDLPSGFSYSINYHTITIRISEGTKINAGSFIIPISYKTFKYNNVLSYTEDGIEYILTSGDDELGYSTMYDDATTYNYGVTYTGIKSGTYRGVVTSIAGIPSDASIGDYFTWVGEDTASTLSQEGSFKQCAIYYYIGDKSSWQWEIDEDFEHLACAMGDVLSIANADLENNNSDAYLYLSHLTANTIFAKMIVANKAFIDALTVNTSFINELVSNNAFIEKLTSDEAFVEHLIATSIELKGDGFVKSTNYEPNVSGMHIDSDGNAEFMGNTHIGGTTEIDGSTTINDELSVTGTTHIGGTTTIDGETTIKDKLNVTGSLTLSGSISSKNYSENISGFNIDNSGNAYFNNGTFRGGLGTIFNFTASSDLNGEMDCPSGLLFIYGKTSSGIVAYSNANELLGVYVISNARSGGQATHSTNYSLKFKPLWKESQLSFTFTEKSSRSSFWTTTWIGINISTTTTYTGGYQGVLLKLS